MAGRTFLMDGQAISNDECYSSDEDEGKYSDHEEDGQEEDEGEVEYMHNNHSAGGQGNHQKHSDRQHEYHDEKNNVEHDEQQYEGGDYEDDDDDDGLDMQIEEDVPCMPNGFYSEVDQFLNRPPPGLSVKNIKGGGKKKGATEAKKKKLPEINDAQQLSNVKSKVSTRRTGPSGKKSTNKVLDERLLQQAFEYSNKLQQEAMVDEVYEASMSLQYQKSSSAPQLRPHQHDCEQRLGGRMDGGGAGVAQRKPRSADTEFKQSASTSARKQQAAYGQGKKKPASSVVRRLRSKTQTSSGGNSGKPPRSVARSGGFDTSCDVESATSNRNVTDFQSLVSNFEQGTHLQQLREELEQSKASMAESRRAMQDISKEMSGKLRI
jgi:hypothetical protein